jgi:hypothetical protein
MASVQYLPSDIEPSGVNGNAPKSRARYYCEACDRLVVAIRPHWGWRIASILSLAFFAFATFTAGFSGSLILGGGVVVFILAALVVGPLNELASAPPKCPVCRRVVVRASRAVAADAPAPVKGSSGPSALVTTLSDAQLDAHHPTGTERAS